MKKSKPGKKKTCSSRLKNLKPQRTSSKVSVVSLTKIRELLLPGLWEIAASPTAFLSEFSEKTSDIGLFTLDELEQAKEDIAKLSK